MSLPGNISSLARFAATPSGSSPVGTAGITATQVAYGDTTANTIKGQSAFTYTEGTGVLLLGVTGSAANASAITGSSAGALSFAAAGSNQNITLTPSGTGAVNVASHNILFDGIANGTGRLQFPAATTSAGGITFGTDWAFYRISAGRGMMDAPGLTITRLDLGTSGTQRGSIVADNSNSVYIVTGSTTALTIDSSQNATAAGKVTVTKQLITTSQTLTYASPTTVDCSLASCFTVTTVNATGSVTFNATNVPASGGEVTILLTNDATSAKTITFGTGFLTTGTLTASAASRHTSITFKSDGSSLYEIGRAVLTA